MTNLDLLMDELCEDLENWQRLPNETYNEGETQISASILRYNSEGLRFNLVKESRENSEALDEYAKADHSERTTETTAYLLEALDTADNPVTVTLSASRTAVINYIQGDEGNLKQGKPEITYENRPFFFKLEKLYSDLEKKLDS